LRDFIARFNQEALSVKNLDPAITLHVLVGNLKLGCFVKNLAMDPPKNMEELHGRSKKWIQLEDYSKTLTISKPQNNKDKPGRNNQNQQFKKVSDRGQDKESVGPRGAYSNYTPLSVSHAKVFRDVINTKLRDRPPPLRSKVKNKEKYCSYHKDHSHNTNECVHLKDAI